MRKLIIGSSLGLLIAGACLLLIHLTFDRTRAFRAQAQVGQPIVQAVENYHKQTGNYPSSLADLVPKFLATPPDIADREHDKIIGWDYHPITNGMSVSYSLRYYMGRGEVEYQPPIWFGNDEGHMTVILKNE